LVEAVGTSLAAAAVHEDRHGGENFEDPVRQAIEGLADELLDDGEVHAEKVRGAPGATDER